MHRGKARVIATKNIYQMILNDESMKDVIAQYETKDDFLMQLCNGVSNNYEMLNLEIESKLKKGWSMNRLNVIDRAILLVASYEILFSDLDKRIIINEAVENAKVYCDDERHKFINGVLDKIGK
ncbi:MAG: transcription antitermination factor NusB [Bacilli bacterium]